MPAPDQSFVRQKPAPAVHAAATLLVVALVAIGSSDSVAFAQDRSVPILGRKSPGLAMMGRGYNSLTGDIKLPCIKYGPTDSLVPHGSGTSGTTSILYVDSEEKLFDHIKVEASFLLRTLGDGGSGIGGEVLVDSHVDHFSTFVLIHGETTKQPVALVNYEYEDWVKDLLEHGGTQDDFLRLCGNEFVAGVELGGQFDGVLEIATASQELERTVKANLTLDVKVVKIDAKTESTFKAISRLTSVKATVLRIGGDSPLPDRTPEGFITAANRLTEDVAHAPWATALITKSYSDLPKPRVNIYKFRQQELILNALGKKYAALLMLKNDADRALEPTTATEFAPFDSKAVESLRSQIVQSMQAINAAAGTCFEDWTKCGDVEVAIPSLAGILKKKKVPADAQKCLDGGSDRKCIVISAKCGQYFGLQRCADGLWGHCNPDSGGCDCHPGDTTTYTCPDKDSKTAGACTRSKTCRQDRTWEPENCDDCLCRPGQVAVNQGCENGCMGTKECRADGTGRNDCPQSPCPRWASARLDSGCTGELPAVAESRDFSWSVSSPNSDGGIITTTRPPNDFRCGGFSGGIQATCGLRFDLSDTGEIKGLQPGSGCWRGKGIALEIDCNDAKLADYQSGQFPAQAQEVECSGRITLKKKGNEVQPGWGCGRGLENPRWFVKYDRLFCDGLGPRQ